MKSIELHEKESKMERDLLKAYREWWPRLMHAIPTLADEDLVRLANPFLVKVLPGYRKAKHKVLFVGKETSGWDSFPVTLNTYKSPNPEMQRDASIKYLQWMYEDLRYHRKWDYHLFWRGMRKLYQSLTNDKNDDGFIHTELVRFDVDGKQPPAHVEELLQREFNVLPMEIQALKPDVVIFLTGPYYDERLKKTFEGVEPVQLEKIDGFGENQLVRVVHPGLPFHSYRTYHPGYSLRKETENFIPVANKLAELVKII